MTAPYSHGGHCILKVGILRPATPHKGSDMWAATRQAAGYLCSDHQGEGGQRRSRGAALRQNSTSGLRLVGIEEL